MIFACFYHGGGSEYDRREDETEANKLKDEFSSKPLNDDAFLEQNIGVPGDDTKKETDLSKMARKGKL